MYYYSIEKSEIQKKGSANKYGSHPIFGFVSRFMYSGGWQVCCVDRGKDCSDHYSKFPIIRKLTGTSSIVIINHMKSILDKHRIPSKLIMNNGPQHNCWEFCQFTESLGKEHITSSPLYPQWNRFADRRAQGTDSQEYTTQVWWARRRLVPWNTVIQNNTSWPVTNLTHWLPELFAKNAFLGHFGVFQPGYWLN